MSEILRLKIYNLVHMLLMIPCHISLSGVCVTSLNDVGYECVCRDGFAGTMCGAVGEACYPGYCSGNGICTDSESGPMCTCGLGYMGDKCQTGTCYI